MAAVPVSAVTVECRYFEQQIYRTEKREWQNVYHDTSIGCPAFFNGKE